MTSDALGKRLAESEGFEWDEGNAIKLWERHEVSPGEAEQVFLNQPLLAAPDEAHSGAEPRFYVLGKTEAERRLFVTFTFRGSLIRVVSARDMGRRERRAYDQIQEGRPAKDPKVQDRRR